MGGLANTMALALKTCNTAESAPPANNNPLTYMLLLIVTVDPLASCRKSATVSDKATALPVCNAHLTHVTHGL